ncbi:uncharacterized protein [Amphiura filiformis]|uniref:uncharacterized protein isoform X2 n=1 Tax=Amphiura filiformis TaxID=82378 RepID=UPI003B21AC4C
MVHPGRCIVIPIILLFVLAIPASLALSQSLYDNDNIVGDPTIYNIDEPQVRHRRQTSDNTSDRTANSTATTDATNVTQSTPSGDATSPNASPSASGTTTDTPMMTTVNGTDIKDKIANCSGEYLCIEDDHDYYKVRYIHPEAAGNYWVDVDNMIRSAPAQIQSSSLATSTRRAKHVTLDFDFEFYGHDIKTLLVTTGGFLYVGNYVHRFLAATQYIAPLMANFDPSVTPKAAIRYAKNSTQFTCEWKNIALADNAQAGQFTFQTTLFKGGRIVFAYKQIPIPVENINAASHPVRIGLADAYYNDTFISPLLIFPWAVLKKRSIYEYHKVFCNFSNIISNTAIEMMPNPVCHDEELDCHQCVSAQIGFDCAWCPSQGRCSSGFDRNRQKWVDSRCHIGNITVEADCNRPQIVNVVTPTKKAPKSTPKPTLKAPRPIDCTDDGPCNHHGQCYTDNFGNSFCKCRYPWIGDRCAVWKPDEDEDISYDPNVKAPTKSQTKPASNHSFSIGGIVFVVIVIVLVTILLSWVVYAYRRPTSNSGIFLIELQNKLRRKGSGESNIKYKYHKPDLSDQSVERV